MSILAPLHVHTQNSSLDGWSTPEEVAQRTIAIGAKGCGCTDHGNVSAHLEFAKVTAKYGLTPVFGCELYHGLTTTPDKKRDQAHLIALAQTNEGLRNLWRLVNQTGRNDHFHHVGRVFWDDLDKYKEGVIFTSACALGLVPQQIVEGNFTALNRYLDTFKDNFYIEISTYPASETFVDEGRDDGFNMRVYNEALVSVAQERGIPMVYGDDGHYADPSQFQYHDAYLARQTGQSIYTPIEERKMYHPPNAVVIKDEAMIRENLYYLPKSVVDECIDNAAAIVDSAKAELPEIKRHLPAYIPATSPFVNPIQKTLSAEELFIDLVKEGIEKRYPNADDTVWERVFYEVETLINDGIHHYFLMGWDEMQIADELGIERGPGRGSSGGAIVSYALGITDVDPLHYNLIFERFWNSGRVDGFPDIDSDFSRARRPQMIQALKDRWGHDKVVAIGTTGYLKPKAVVDKLREACGMTYVEANELKEIVGKTTKIEILGHEQIGWSREFEPDKKYYVEDDCQEEINKWVKAAGAERYPERMYYVDMCRATCSRVSQYGIHASGLVISDVDTADQLPAQIRGGKDGVPATMFTMKDVDKRMFVKLDVLGLRTLDVLAYWKEAMKEKYDVDINWSGLDLEEHPQEMWDLLTRFTAGIFQIEDGYGRQICKLMKPKSIDDLAVVGALNRPGPIQAGIPDDYIARMKGEQEVTYPHPRFKELTEEYLDETYGLWVFQEQIIKFFNSLDYTLSESDAIRKIMGKKKPEEMDGVRDGLGEWEGRGYLEMAVKAGIPQNIAQDIWEDIEGFADYCFNLSHSVEYGVITFRTLFAKYYGAAEFYTAVIRSLDPSTDGEKRKEQLPILINECRRQHIGVHPPDIRYSRGHIYSVDDDIYFGFGDIANVRASGAFVVQLRDEIGLDISSSQNFINALEKYNEQWSLAKKEGHVFGQSPKFRLNKKKIESLIAAGCWNGVEDNQISLTQQQALELSMLGVILTDNSQEVLDKYADIIADCHDYSEALRDHSIKEAETGKSEFIYTLPGVVTNIAEKTARKSGETFAILTISYETDEISFMIGVKDWKHLKRVFKMLTPGVFTIKQRADTQYGPSYALMNGSKLK